MSEDKEKILIEFSLTPDSKAKLQNFLDENIQALNSGTILIRQKAKKELQTLISGDGAGSGAFPKESLETISSILKGGSEYAVIIHNAPEIEGFQKGNAAPLPNETYSYHIGNTLYEMNGLRPVRATSDSRSSHLKDPLVRNMLASEVHRDSMEAEKEGNITPVAENIIFSCPYNGENAVTNFIHLRRAIESLTPDERKAVIVEMGDKLSDETKIGVERCNLDQVLECLNTPPESKNFLRRVAIYTDPEESWGPESPQVTKFREAMKRESVSVNLQPGDLLVLNERAIFHQATPGDPNSIKQLPKEEPLSRIMIHNAGGAGGRYA